MQFLNYLYKKFYLRFTVKNLMMSVLTFNYVVACFQRQFFKHGLMLIICKEIICIIVRFDMTKAQTLNYFKNITSICYIHKLELKLFFLIYAKENKIDFKTYKKYLLFQNF